VPARKRPEKLEPTPPGEDVSEKIDPDHTDDDFLRDLDRASRRIEEAKERLGDPSEPDEESPRTAE
jgi:hypothetical protein